MAESSGAGDLTATERADIEGIFLVVEEGTLYELLAVRDNVDRRTIRDAYFRLSKQFHPDAYYGRNLGAYRERLESVFRALTNAYDVLSNKNQRAEYDRSIGLDPTRALVSAAPPAEAAKDPAPAADQTGPVRPMAPPRTTSVTQPAVVPPRSMSTSQQAAVRPPSDPLRTTGQSAPVRPVAGTSEPIRPPPIVPRSTTASREPIAKPSVASMPAVAPNDEVQRAAREALARKLAGSRTLSHPSMPAVQPGAISAGASLQAQFANREDLAQRNKLDNLRRSANELASKGDFLGASNTMQIAVAMAPEDATIKSEASEILRRLNLHMAPQNVEAAKDAERNRQFERAAVLWTKVASVLPEDFESNFRLGRCLLTIGRDLARAAEAARRSVAAAPRRIEGHLLLAEIFEAAGKPASARSAAEQAAKLDPTSPAVKDLLARLR
jgi:tetratricopeptide (TPR) repeat protein